jgi:3-hydroxy-9,10-secoandrosta-1,3,5(10)-triene-9,17-dione monooxygenase reductase component
VTGNIDGKRFRQALGAFTTGVTIVTTVAEGRDIGVTANSFNSVSLDPPMVLWSIARTSSNFSAFHAASFFAVHVLSADQDALASRFAQRGIDRFAGLNLERGPGGIALLEGCAARFQCKSAFQYEGGDHMILVGEVLEYDHYEREPLVYKSGRYAFAVPKAGEAAAPPAAPADSSAVPGAIAPDFLLYQLGRAYFQMRRRIQPELDRRQLSGAEHYVISVLGIRGGRSIAELDAQAALSGLKITAETARKLVADGLVGIDETAGEPRLSLTHAGQRMLVEVMAIAKAACDDAETGFDPSESRLLRQFLSRLIASSDPGLPSPWKG